MNKKLNYINVKIWLFPLLMLVVGAIAFPFLPAEIPCQWDAAGNVTNMAPRLIVFLIPGLTAALLLMSSIAPFIDPKKEAYGKMRREYNTIHFVTVLLLFVGQLFMIGNAIGVPIPFGSKLLALFPGVLLMVSGNFLPKIPQNYLTGIKTVWAYSSEVVWNKTMRFAGMLWFACGLLMSVTVFIPWSFQGAVNIGIIVLLFLAPRVYALAAHRNYAGEE